jgi:hypothetical protein
MEIRITGVCAAQKAAFTKIAANSRASTTRL